MPSTSFIVFALLTNPFADTVVSYDAGSGGADGYTDPTAALGEPTRFTGEGVWPSVVSQFNPPFMPSELVSIGIGGELVLSFDEPVVDDPAHRTAPLDDEPLVGGFLLGRHGASAVAVDCQFGDRFSSQARTPSS